jgi:hypothetical protein
MTDSLSHRRKAVKVYGMTTFREGKQVRQIVACTSRAEVARITGLTRRALDHSCSTTGNATELEVALAEPGTVFWRPLNDWQGEFRRV